MNVHKLNREQLKQLKQSYWCEHNVEEPSYYELANIDDLVHDETVFQEYAGVNFVQEDFV